MTGRQLADALDRRFGFSSNGTSLRTECVAGATTFLTMAYIVFVQPAVLSGAMFGMETGMDMGALTTATCLSAALATALMGWWARLPVALAPGMGQNFFFVFTAIPAATAAGFANAWEVALGAVFVSGALFLGLSLTGIRERLLHSLSPSLKAGIGVGIGLFIAFIGLRNAGLVIADPGTFVKLNARLFSPDLLLFFLGLLLTTGLGARGVRGAVLWGMLVTTLATIVCKLLLPALPEGLASAMGVGDSMLAERFQIAEAVVAAPPSIGPLLLKMDVAAACSAAMIPLVIVFLFMDVFDTMGTLVGVGERAGLMKDGRLPRAREAMLSDAVGTVAGAAMGTSTVTSYIESAAGVEAGGRTGLTALVVSGLFLVALFFSPIIAMVGSYPPITAPALVIVGATMMRGAAKIDWADLTEAVPAFLIVAGIPLTFSIGDGLALGFISHPLVKALGGKAREVTWPSAALSVALILYFLFVRGTM